MEKIIKCLIDIENIAGSLYRDTAMYFKEDQTLSAFLKDLAEDEAWHSRVMVSAAKYLHGLDRQIKFAISLDDDTISNIKSPFLKNRELLSKRDLTKEDAISCLVTTEFSEWNDIFLYVIDELKSTSKEFQYVASKIQAHKNYIEEFVKSLPEGDKYSDILKSIPSIWLEKILIVEDEPAIVDLLKAIFKMSSIIETTDNGHSALKKVTEQYFDVIISDIDLPLLDGIEFFKQAAACDSSIGKRFLFFTGTPSNEIITFLNENNLSYITKPAPINKIKQGVQNILKNTKRR